MKMINFLLSKIKFKSMFKFKCPWVSVGIIRICDKE